MDSFLATPFSEPPYFLLLTAIVFAVVFLRYLLFSGIYHYLFYRWLGPRFLVVFPQMSLSQTSSISFRGLRIPDLAGLLPIAAWKQFV